MLERFKLCDDLIDPDRIAMMMIVLQIDIEKQMMIGVTDAYSFCRSFYSYA